MSNLKGAERPTLVFFMNKVDKFEDLCYVSNEIAQNRRMRAKHISGGISGLMNYLKTLSQ